MEKKFFGFDGATNYPSEDQSEAGAMTELSDLHLSLIGGGIGDTIL